MNRSERRRMSKRGAPPGAPGGRTAMLMEARRLGEQGRMDEAEAICRRLIAANAADADAQALLAPILLSRGQCQQAADAAERALRLRPGHANAAFNLGNAMMELGRVADAERAYRLAAASLPGDATVQASLAEAQEAGMRLAEAVEAGGRAMTLAPGDPHLRAAQATRMQMACDWAGLGRLLPMLDRDERDALARGAAPAETLFSHISRCEDPARNAALARAAAAQFQRIAPMPPVAAAPKAKLRIGYLSSDFQDHATAHLITGLLRRHDRAAVEVHCFSHGRDNGGGFRDAIRAACDSFTDLMGLGDAEAARRIRAAGIDILVDLKGHTHGNRLEICAMRPAPVQASYLGYPGTTGANFIDYAIVDPVVLSPEEAALWTEQPVYMPHCYQVNDDAQKIARTGLTRARAGLPESSFVFASFNSPMKIGPATFRAWMVILKAVPGSVLWLLAHNAAATSNLRRAAEAAGVPTQRLVFSPPLPKPEHLERIALADLALDTFIYNGHTTTSDCLWAGVPVVTTMGRHFASRVCASLLSAIGLSELVARDVAEYERLAVALANDSRRLAGLRAGLADARTAAPLFDTARFARDLERGYRAMWQRAASGLPPAPIRL